MLRLLIPLLLLAAAVYVVFWLIDRRSQGQGGDGGTKPIPRGPVGPDDDEDFLRELDRRRRHSKPGQKPPVTPPPPPADGPEKKAAEKEPSEESPEDDLPDPLPRDRAPDGQISDEGGTSTT